jgi:large subunit ribosomal protein L13
MTTYTASAKNIERNWVLIDAEDLVLGRLAAEASRLLRGKHKPTYTPNIDCGDHVIIINAEKVRLTGNKVANKKYYWHTGYPGGIKERTAKETLSGNFPDRVVEKAIQRMISRNPLGRQQLRKLHVYTGNTHPHEGQNPQVLDFAKKNKKNSVNE